MLDYVFLGTSSIAVIVFIFFLVKINQKEIASGNGGPKTITCWNCKEKLVPISHTPIRLVCVNPKCKARDKQAIKKMKKEGQ